MSGIESITYNTIITNIKNTIKSNCVNISNFAGIPAAFKSGYSNKITISGGNTAATCYCTVTSNGNYVTQATTSDVDTDMTNFCNTIGLTPYLSQNVKDTEFVKFMNDIIAFCAAKLAFATSVYNTNRYLIYNKNQTTYGTTYTINEGSADKQVVTTDVTSAINKLMTDINKVIREIPVSYALNYS